jgi:ferric-dicitrate binding protein FerR (iron transport regulator)
MSTPGVLASDAERDEVARIVQNASGEGRLSLTETEERLASVYAARYRHELAEITADLPERRPPQRPVRPLRVHAVVVALIGALLVARWLVSGVPFFWPAFPLGWLVISLMIHATVRRRRGFVPR